MSVQVFLQGKIVGIEGFLLSPGPIARDDADLGGSRLLTGRSRWVTLLSEVLPRALLCELGLAKVLLGSSGGGHFLLVLPSEARPAAHEFLDAASREIHELGGGHLQLVSAVTENLGDWSVVRKRLSEAMQRQRGTPAASLGTGVFSAFSPASDGDPAEYFSRDMAEELQVAQSIGWSPEAPGRVLVGAGKHTWPLASGPSVESIAMARHTATAEDGATSADLGTLAHRAQGRAAWGVLRGDVDNLGIRFRRLQTIEEHVQLSLMYKQFFAGELELICSLPEYWRKVSVFYSGGDDFAVYGAWDALIPLAREIQRLFHRFSEENLKDFPGPEGKTISMSIAIARDSDSDFASVYEEAGDRLAMAKAADKDCVSVLGHILEWRQLAAASDLRETMLRMAAELDSPRRLLLDLTAFYRKAAAVGRPGRAMGRRFEKPWQVQRHLTRALGETHDKELQRLRTHLTNEILAKGATEMKLRPGGRVALEWARLSAEV
jgi:CRISPR-associated protein Csm1